MRHSFEQVAPQNDPPLIAFQPLSWQMQMAVEGQQEDESSAGRQAIGVPRTATLVFHCCARL